MKRTCTCCGDSHVGLGRYCRDCYTSSKAARAEAQKVSRHVYDLVYGAYMAGVGDGRQSYKARMVEALKMLREPLPSDSDTHRMAETEGLEAKPE